MSGKGKGGGSRQIEISDWTCQVDSHHPCDWDRNLLHVVKDTNAHKHTYRFSPETQEWYRQTNRSGKKKIEGGSAGVAAELERLRAENAQLQRLAKTGTSSTGSYRPEERREARSRQPQGGREQRARSSPGIQPGQKNIKESAAATPDSDALRAERRGVRSDPYGGRSSSSAAGGEARGWYPRLELSELKFAKHSGVNNGDWLLKGASATPRDSGGARGSGRGSAKSEPQPSGEVVLKQNRAASPTSPADSGPATVVTSPAETPAEEGAGDKAPAEEEGAGDTEGTHSPDKEVPPSESPRPEPESAPTGQTTDTAEPSRREKDEPSLEAAIEAAAAESLAEDQRRAAELRGDEADLHSESEPGEWAEVKKRRRSSSPRARSSQPQRRSSSPRARASQPQGRTKEDEGSSDSYQSFPGGDELTSAGHRGAPGLTIAKRRRTYDILWLGPVGEYRSREERDVWIAVDLHHSLDDGRDNAWPTIPEEKGRALLALQKEYNVLPLILTYVGLTDARVTSIERGLDDWARKLGLDARLVVVDQHAGQPFGRPGLARARSDLTLPQLERHEFSTGGKDWVCYQESAAALFDDSWRNLNPARRLGIAIYQVKRGDLVEQFRRFRYDLERNREWYTRKAARRRTLIPKEAPEDEKQAHLVERRRCRRCEQIGHIARNCPQPPGDGERESENKGASKGKGKDRARSERPRPQY